MKKLLRHTLSATAFIAPLAIFFVPFISDAQGVTLLQDKVFGDSTLASGSPGSYLQNIYVTAVGLAGIMAVVILVWGGFELIASPINPQMREDAKKRIWAALGGLLLVLASVTILGTINPAFTGFSFKLGEIAKTGAPGGAGAPGAQATIPPSNITHEQAVGQLPNVNVTSSGGCTSQSQANCTSLSGVQPETITEINRLSTEAGCKKGTCNVTGVREVGHNGGTSHINGLAFDFTDDNEKVNTTIQGYAKYKSGTNSNGERQYISASGAVYTRESNHWHVAVQKKS